MNNPGNSQEQETPNGDVVSQDPKDVLVRFINVKSDDNDNMVAIEESVKEARELLSQTGPIDASKYAMFLKGISSDLSKETGLFLELTLAFDPTVASALLRNEYRVETAGQFAREKKDEKWLDDLSVNDETQCVIDVDEFKALSSSVKMADVLLKSCEDGDKPAEDYIVALIHQMLFEGVRSYDAQHMQDQFVEAIALAKLFSLVAGPDSQCQIIYSQLNSAIPVFTEDASHLGIFLTQVFEKEIEYSSVSKVCAYTHEMLFSDNFYDYTFKELFVGATRSFTEKYPSLNILPRFFEAVLNAFTLYSQGCSPSDLVALCDEEQQRECMELIRTRAKQSISVPRKIKHKVNGIEKLFKLCFEEPSDIYLALKYVATGDDSNRDYVKKTLKKFCKNKALEGEYGEYYDIENDSIEEFIDRKWAEATIGLSTEKMRLKYDSRTKVVNAVKDCLDILHKWLRATITILPRNRNEISAVRNTILEYIEQLIVQINESEKSIELQILKASLESIQEKLAPQSGKDRTFYTLLRSGLFVFDQGRMIWNDDVVESLNKIQFAQPWRPMLSHIACEDYDLRVVYNKIKEADFDSPLFDNFGQFEIIGQIIGADAKEYAIPENCLQDAKANADSEARDFSDKLEISYAYGRIGENDRERLAELSGSGGSFRKFFYERKAFGCWRVFLDALRNEIRIFSRENRKEVCENLERALRSRPDDENCPLLIEARRLINEDQNYAVAEEFIYRFRNNESELPFESDSSSRHYFLEFISDEVYNDLFKYLDDRVIRGMDFANASREYIQLTYRRNPQFAARYERNAMNFTDSWPSWRRLLTGDIVAQFFRGLGFNVVGSEIAKGRAGLNMLKFNLKIRKSPQNRAGYIHPISIFGTQMKDTISVVCLNGARFGRELVAEVCSLNFVGAFVVLLDSCLSRIERREMARYFFEHMSDHASFLVIDRVLALYLASLPENERLPAMLQCALPYTRYQPFTKGAGSTSDEMFFGRTEELHDIRDMKGTSIVYGGRQLGKTALLERASHLDHNPDEKEFVVMASFKECRDERSFVTKLRTKSNNVLGDYNVVFKAENIETFTEEIRAYLQDGTISVLRLLLDEMDDFLNSISGNSYRELTPLVDLQREYAGRFKFVFAGLHNVCRAANANEENNILGQLTEPRCVEPLKASDARNLLVRPLRYLGYQISNESHIATILTNTNYYPGMIQFFGYFLVAEIPEQYCLPYNPANENPPFQLHDDRLASIMNDENLNEAIKNKFRLSLELDERYYMLARCLAVQYHLCDNDFTQFGDGFDIDVIIETASNYNISCLHSLSREEVKALLDEMQKMGILSKPDSDHYLLRRHSFIDVIGPNFDDLEKEILEMNK